MSSAGRHIGHRRSFLRASSPPTRRFARTIRPPGDVASALTASSTHRPSLILHANLVTYAILPLSHAKPHQRRTTKTTRRTVSWRICTMGRQTQSQCHLSSLRLGVSSFQPSVGRIRDLLGGRSYRDLWIRKWQIGAALLHALGNPIRSCRPVFHLGKILLCRMEKEAHLLCDHKSASNRHRSSP